MDNPIRLIDRLEERGLIDRWGFVSFAFAGSIAIILAKHLEAGAVAVAVGAVLLLLAYAWLVQSRGTAKLRSDQAGDNCYYLGLIYTLASLAYAIFTFDPAGTATTIVQGFGIALATTIAGLILRVFFNQSRVDLYETEDSARLELAQAASRLKSELSQIAVSFSDFGHQTRQIITEMRDAAVETVEGTAKASTQAVEQVAAMAQDTLKAQSTDLGNKSRRLGQATEKVAVSIEQNAERLDAAALSSERFAAVVEKLHQAATGARNAAQAVADQVGLASQVHGSVSESSRSLVAATERIDRIVADTSTAVLRFQSDLQARLQDVEIGPNAAVQKTIAGVAEVAETLRSSVDRLVSAHRNSAQEIEAETSSLLAALRSHNSALEAELGRSRQNVARVHGALVDMTGELLEQVERRAS
jgi:hypothetical protein